LIRSLPRPAPPASLSPTLPLHTRPRHLPSRRPASAHPTPPPPSSTRLPSSHPPRLAELRHHASSSPAQLIQASSAPRSLPAPRLATCSPRRACTQLAYSSRMHRTKPPLFTDS
jgi:hypothetical protein